MRSLDYRSGSVRLNDFENQNHSLTDLKRFLALLPMTDLKLLVISTKNEEKSIAKKRFSSADFQFSPSYLRFEMTTPNKLSSTHYAQSILGELSE